MKKVALNSAECYYQSKSHRRKAAPRKGPHFHIWVVPVVTQEQLNFYNTTYACTLSIVLVDNCL